MAKREKYDLSKPPTMSDEFLMGAAPTVSELRLRTEEEAAGDLTINWDLLEEVRALDDEPTDD